MDFSHPTRLVPPDLWPCWTSQVSRDAVPYNWTNSKNKTCHWNLFMSNPLWIVLSKVLFLLTLTTPALHKCVQQGTQHLFTLSRSSPIQTLRLFLEVCMCSNRLVLLLEKKYISSCFSMLLQYCWSLKAISVLYWGQQAEIVAREQKVFCVSVYLVF